MHPIPFVAGGPGTGKTRLLEELKNLVQERALNDADDQVREIFANMIAVVITFGNGSAASDSDVMLGGEIALCTWILHRYFVEGNSNMQYENFVNQCIKLGLRKGGLMLGTVLKTITMDKYGQQQQSGNTSAFLLCIDETNKLIDLDTPLTQVTFRTVVNAVGRLSCGKAVENIFFIPILAGTLEQPLSQIITKSMHPALVLPLDLLSNADTIKIAQENSGLDKHYVTTTASFR